MSLPTPLGIDEVDEKIFEENLRSRSGESKTYVFFNRPLLMQRPTPVGPSLGRLPGLLIQVIEPPRGLLFGDDRRLWRSDNFDCGGWAS